MYKLAFVATAYIKRYDGVSVYLENLLRELLSHDKFQNQTFSMDVYVGKSVIDLLKERLNISLNNKNIKFIAIEDKNIFTKTFDLTQKLYQQKRYNLIFMANLMPVLFTPGPKIKVIHDFSKRRFPELYSRFGLLQNLFYIKSSIMLDDGIGYISQSTKDDLKKFFGIDETKKKLLYVPNGIPFKVKNYKRGDNSFMNAKYKEKDLQFCVVGRINRHKGFDRLLKFCNYLEKNHQKFKNFDTIQLNIVGKQTKETQDIFNNQNFKKLKLVFHGFLDDDGLNDIYKKSHFCFFLSRNEGYGLPLIEAMWFRSIPILSNIPIFREIMGEDYPLFDDTTGYEESIGNFILKIYDDKDFYDSIKNTIESTIKKELDGYKVAANNLINYLISNK